MSDTHRKHTAPKEYGRRRPKSKTQPVKAEKSSKRQRRDWRKELT